jgi:hypothetical protein
MDFRRATVLSACALVWAAAAGRAAADEPSQAAPCLGVTVSATPASGHSETDKGFSARRILDLNFHVELASRVTPESLALKVFTPNGHLYQQIDVPVAPAGSGEATRALPGYPFPVKVAAVRAERSAEDAGTRTLVDAPPFLVAGTNIVSSSLYGRWRVEAWVKDAPSACSAQFNIFP